MVRNRCKYWWAALALSSSITQAAECAPPVTALMKGAPIPADMLVTVSNMMQAPYNRWAFHHVRQLQPSSEVSRGEGAPRQLAESPVDLDALDFRVGDNSKVSLDAWLKESCTDAFLVLHKGRIVYERYFNEMTPASEHLMCSVTKSFISTMTLDLIDQGRIDPTRLLQSYLPELAHSAFGDATVQQVLDMTTSLSFSEDYADPQADIWKYALSLSPADMVPAAYQGPRTIYDYLPTLKKAATAHGYGFHYVTPNADVLAWLNTRVSGQTASSLLSETIWQKLGAERDAYFSIASAGTELTGGGLNMTARDAARFGQMILQRGQYNGQTVLPEAVAARILQPGVSETFGRLYDEPWYVEVTYAYHDMWWTFNNPHKAISAIGINGQFIYIDPVAELVVVKQSSHPDAESEINDVIGPQIWYQIATHLMQQKVTP